MKKNVGGIDKSIRIVLGIVLILVGLFAQLGGGIKIVLFVLAGIAFFTGFFGL